MGIIQRLLSHPISGKYQAPGFRIPDRKRKHAPQFCDTIEPKLFIMVDDRLRILSVKDCMPLAEIRPKLLKIVDFSVEDDPNRAILIRHRLMSRSAEIQDA